MSLQRGEVVQVILDPAVGSEIKKSRSCVIVQRDAANRTSPATIVCPLTDAGSSTGNLLNVFVPGGVGGTKKASLVVCNQVRAIDASRVGERYGKLPDDILAGVERGLRAILDL